MAAAMGLEIERKFLVVNDQWRTSATSHRRLRQGFLTKTSFGCVRVRRWPVGATLTIKGPRIGICREEFEYAIPLAEADRMLRDLCAKPLMEKVRYRVEHAGMNWEVDLYGGAAGGLALAEIELDYPDQPFVVPPWVGAEVTHDPYYGSAAISARGLGKVRDVRAKPPRKSRAAGA
jgi:adenylate cyclase